MTAAVTALRLDDDATPIEAVVILVPPKKRGSLERFPVWWNRLRFHQTGNARTGDRVATGIFRSADSSRMECALAPAQTRITLPGFMMFCGSRARLRVRMVSSSTWLR